jgi:hypothetical protein
VTPKRRQRRVLAPGLALVDPLVPVEIAQDNPLATAWRHLDLALNDSSTGNFSPPKLDLPVNIKLGKSS